MYPCQCEGQSNGVLIKEVSAFQLCPLIKVLLYILYLHNAHMHMYSIMYCIICCILILFHRGGVTINTHDGLV